MLVREHRELTNQALSAQQMVQLFERCDAFRRPSRFAEVLQAFGLREDELNLPARVQMLAQALSAAQAIPAGQIAQHCAQQFPGQTHKIAAAIQAARISAVEVYLEACRT